MKDTTTQFLRVTGFNSNTYPILNIFPQLRVLKNSFYIAFFYMIFNE